MSLIAVRPNRAGLSHEELKAYVLRRAADFTMVPAAALKAMEIGRNPACSVAEYAAAIECDVRLAADILGMANSSLHATGAPASSLHDAVRRLGLRRCQSLILSTCTAGLMRSLPFDQSQRRECLWRHGYMVAVICRHLNDDLRLGFTGEEFTAGLMHDLGRSLLAAIVPEADAAVEQHGDEGLDVIDKERAVLGTDHCELGAAFAARNRLPASLIAVIQHHHEPSRAGEFQKLAALVSVADHMAHQLEACRAGLSDDTEPAVCPFIPYLAEGERVRRALAGVTADMADRAAAEARQLIA